MFRPYPKPEKSKKKKRVVVADSVYYKVYTRDKGKCQLCGSPYNLALHHIVYRSEDKTRINDVTNLIMLCTRCHLLVHSNKHKYQPMLKEKITKIYKEDLK